MFGVHRIGHPMDPTTLNVGNCGQKGVGHSGSVRGRMKLHAASDASGVPYPLLSAIAYIESRWVHRVPDPMDTEHAPSFGIMGLRDNAWFGSTLSQAAGVAGVSKEKLEED